MEATWIAERWIYERLSTDPQLTALVGGRIYADIANGNPASPYVLFARLDGQDVRVVGPTIVAGRLRYVVRGVAESGSDSVLAPIAARIHALLHAQRGATTAGTVLGCVREQPFKLVEAPDGRQFRHLGGIYILWAQE